MRIYIAGPYGIYNPEQVVAGYVIKADQMARDLRARGHAVFCPLKMVSGWPELPIPENAWRSPDIGMIETWAEAVMRLPGESEGADIEVALARKIGLPVFTPQDYVDGRL